LAIIEGLTAEPSSLTGVGVAAHLHARLQRRSCSVLKNQPQRRQTAIAQRFRAGKPRRAFLARSGGGLPFFKSIERARPVLPFSSE